MIRFFSLFFIFLWSSAFITSKVIIEDATPITALCFRFALVAIGFWLFALYKGERLSVARSEAIQLAITGILFHGVYLGGVFFSIAKGMPAGLSALIVSLQPILTAILAGPILHEQITGRQWIGIVLGFGGTALVLGFDIGTDIPLIAFLACLTALLAVTTATLWQKQISGKLSLSVSNFYQAGAAFLFHLSLMGIIETPSIDFTASFIWAMGWQIIAISFGAFTILMYLIHVGSASRVSSLFFLVPPVSAVMAWLFLAEPLIYLDIIGLALATIGVYMVMNLGKQKT